jgi:hypothetical protein
VPFIAEELVPNNPEVHRLVISSPGDACPDYTKKRPFIDRVFSFLPLSKPVSLKTKSIKFIRMTRDYTWSRWENIWKFAVYPSERRLLYGQIAVHQPIWDRYIAALLFIPPVVGDEQQSSVQ